MQNLTFEKIRGTGNLLYEYVRGSTAYGLATEHSDIDKGGVFMCSHDTLLSMPDEYQEQVSDERNDVVWYELGRFLFLLCKSNPNVLEALFVPDKFVLYEHPIITELKKNRDIFVTKECFKPFIEYSASQIKKARGLNKKVNEPILFRKTPIDFCRTFWYQGSTTMLNFLEKNGLKQIYCGLIHVNDMEGAYGVYYDWGQHIRMEFKSGDEFADFIMSDKSEPFLNAMKGVNKDLYKILTQHRDLNGLVNLQEYREDYKLIFDTISPSGYHGIQKEDGSSNAVHLDSVKEGEKPICHMMFYKNSYEQHCRKYKEQKEWEVKRNPQRYLENINNGRGYDAKNLCHCMRLINMGLEIAKTGEVKVDRTDIDRELLLKIRRGEFSYEELMAMEEERKAELEELIPVSTIPNTIDRDKVNEVLINIRKNYYQNYGN